MFVVVGPVSSRSANAFVAHSRRLLAARHEQADSSTAALSDDVAASFEAVLADWASIARSSRQFRWSAEIETETAEYLVYAFYRVSERSAEAVEAGRQPELPAAAEPFYNALVQALVDGLDAEGSGSSDFADHLRQFWPGVHPDPGRTRAR